jgi:[acyl-carrier-protein] S-malonyltransferase
VDDALEQDLSRLMFEGPEDELVLTENAQPALMAVSLAAVRAIEEQGGFALSSKGSYVAGHSLGEYSALAAMDALSAGDAARLLRRRGRAMQQAVPVGRGAMSAIMGLDLETVQGIADEAARDQVCEIANDNAPGQVVISGHAEAVERAVEIAKQRGAKRAVMLNVSAPFHCSLMQPAAEEMEQALAETEIHAPNLPVVANVTAYALESPDEIRERLCQQVTHTVRWRESMAYARDKGVDRLYEIGHGKVLSGLAKRIDRGLTAMPVGTPGEIETFLNELADA